MPKPTDQVTDEDYNKAIEADKTVDMIRDTPLEIPYGYKFTKINLEDRN